MVDQKQSSQLCVTVAESWMRGLERELGSIADDLFCVANESAQITVRLSVSSLASRLSRQSEQVIRCRHFPAESFPVTNLCEPPPQSKPAPRRRLQTTKVKRRRRASA